MIEEPIEEPKVKQRERAVAIFYVGEALGNAEKACIMAGYSKRYARGNAYKIVAKSGVQKYIDYLNRKISEKNIATAETIQAFWSKVMLDEKEKTRDRLKASEYLAKGKGLFNNDW